MFTLKNKTQTLYLGYYVCSLELINLCGSPFYIENKHVKMDSLKPFYLTPFSVFRGHICVRELNGSVPTCNLKWYSPDTRLPPQ